MGSFQNGSPIYWRALFIGDLRQRLNPFSVVMAICDPPPSDAIAGVRPYFQVNEKSPSRGRFFLLKAQPCEGRIGGRLFAGLFHEASQLILLGVG